MSSTRPPDVVLLATDWQPRALIRAQLLEEGFEVVATNTWPMMRRQLRPGRKPRLAIVDLQNLSQPEEVLSNVRVLIPPNRVLVVAAMGTIAPAEIERLGFRVLKRPVGIDEVVAAAAEALRDVAHGKDPA